MSLGKNIKKIANNISIGWRIYKHTSGIKPISTGAVLDTSKCKDIQLLSQQLNLLLLNKNQSERLCYSFPQIERSIRKNLIISDIEPNKGVKISFELPIKNPKDLELDLPFQIEKEVKEPGEIINKNAASHMCRIRKKKMRKHKRKKFIKKHKAEILKKKIRLFVEKEDIFQNSLKEVLSQTEAYSPEKYVQQMLEDAHWEKPITRVRGFLAPKWVIKEHLERKKEKEMLQQRIIECQK